MSLRQDFEWWSDVRDVAVAVSRYWSLVGQPDSEGCRPWLGNISALGYGTFLFRGKRVGAHELAVFLTTGEIPPAGWDTCHSCHHRWCVAPEHLRYDTRKGNVGDAIRADRHNRGERNGQARITEAMVLEIRARIAGGASIRRVAESLGVSDGCVSQVASGKSWKHVGGPITARRPGAPLRTLS